MPKYPRRIGLITSPTGAVAHDVVSVLRRRWPPATIVFIPAAVQGLGAVPELLRGLELAGALGNLDLVIVARGGGSAEDLWCFNDEDLARAAGRCPIPVISAVGHETDFTIFDFAADLRAPTPSVAAELAAPDVREVQAVILQLRRRLNTALGGKTRLARSQLEAARARLTLAGPGEQLRRLRLELAAYGTRVRVSARHRVKIEAQKILGLSNQLRALHPQRILERGYALVRTAEGEVVSNAARAVPGSKLGIFWHDGTAAVTVDDE